MLAVLLVLRGEADVVSLLDRYTQLQRVNGVQPQALVEEGGIRDDVLRLYVFQLERADDQALDFKLKAIQLWTFLTLLGDFLTMGNYTGLQLLCQYSRPSARFLPAVCFHGDPLQRLYFEHHWPLPGK